MGPLVSGLTSFLHDRIRDFLATERFQTAWDNLNRTAHDALVAVLTGEETDLITSQGTTVTVNLGELLSMAKERLVAEGLTIVERVPDVSIQYTLLQSDKLPDIRTYTQLLNTAGTWLPWVALALLIAGVLVAPNRRRGIIVGAAMLGITVALLLGAMSFARDYYLDRLPPEVMSPDAVAAVYDAVVRFLISALQTLLVVTAILVVGALLAGPSRTGGGVPSPAEQGPQRRLGRTDARGRVGHDDWSGARRGVPSDPDWTRPAGHRRVHHCGASQHRRGALGDVWRPRCAGVAGDSRTGRDRAGPLWVSQHGAERPETS